MRTPVSQLVLGGLTAEELELLSAFRRLNKSQKSRAVGFLLGMAE